MKVTSQIKRVFEDSEIEKLRKAVLRDKIIIKAMLKIIEDVSLDLSKPTSLSEIEGTSWATRKAYTEGGRYYLEQLASIFKEK